MRFNQAEYAVYYQKQQQEGGYPGKLLPFVMDAVKDCRTVIDIGSGTGFFSIPLSESGHRVTAVEPSAEMINIMKKNLSPDALSSIVICQTEWENWEGDRHDAAICIHSLYPMPDVKNAVYRINSSAAKKIIIVRDSSGMKTLTGIVREKLNIHSSRDLNADIKVILNELKADWRAVNIYEERRHVIKDIPGETDSILYQLKLGAEYRNEIEDIVKKHVESSVTGKYFTAIYSDNAYIF